MAAERSRPKLSRSLACVSYIFNSAVSPRSVLHPEPDLGPPDRYPPFCAIRWREPRRFDHAGRTARTTGASFCLMRWVVRNDHGRPRGRVRGRETRFPSLPTNLKTVAALYCKICLARCLSNSGKGVSAILHMADSYEPRRAI